MAGVNLLLLVVAAASAAHASKVEAEPVKVLLYDDPECSPCQYFVIDQLQPTFEEIGEIMEVEINTYGFTAEPYEGDEFLFNRIVECAQVHVPDTATFLEFDACFMNTEHDGPTCASETGVDWNTIETCATSDEGKDLLHEAGVREGEQEPYVGFYPWIAINGVGPNRDAQDDLKIQVCNAYTGTLPPGCK